jgi:hypothetical protein
MDITIETMYNMDNDLRTKVSRLIRQDACGTCLQGKAAALESFLRNVEAMTRTEKKISLLTAMATLYAADVSQPVRVRSTGQRHRFHYFVPLVGRVCKCSFLECYDVSSATVARYKTRIQRGCIL